MPKQQVTIEVDIPQGYEATGEFRSPTYGDLYLHHGRAENARFEIYASDFLVLRKAWQWPSWLLAPWIAKDDGDPVWIAFNEKPSANTQAGVWSGALIYRIVPHIYDFTPPPCTDWKQSLRRNPNV